MRNVINMIKEELTEEKKEQREKIREFERQQISYQRAGLPPQIASWIGYFFCVFAAACPAQVYAKDKEGILGIVMVIYVWVVLGAQFFIMPYLQFQEGKKLVSVLQKIKYLPVDSREIKIVCMGYLMKYIKRIFEIALVVQCVMALLLFHEIAGINLLTAGAIAGLPLFAVGLTILCNHYPKK